MLRTIMLFLLTVIGACLSTFLSVEGKRQHHLKGYHLAAIGGSGIQEGTFQRRWRLAVAADKTLESNIRKELERILSQAPNDDGPTLKDPTSQLKEAKRIRKLILPDRQDVFFNKYRAVESIRDRGFLGDAYTWLFGDNEYVTFSAWQYRPNILQKGGNITLEIHYKIPIKVGKGRELCFKPIVVYSCNVTPGKYVPGSAIFSPGSVEVLTHPFLPWRKFHAGTVKIAPPRLPTVFSS